MPTQNRAEPKRRRTKLSVRADLLKIAHENNLNLSEMLEHGILDYCGTKWLEENKGGIEAYNEQIDRNGVIAKSHRSF